MAESQTDTTDELTENGLYSDDLRRVDYEDVYGEPVYEDDDRVIFGDTELYELNEAAEQLDMSRADLHSRMVELALEHVDDAGIDDPWDLVDPVVIDADTFDNEDN